MSAIKEHFHEEICNADFTRRAAITARAETLKEVIEILEKQSKYNIESGFQNDAEVCDWILENKIRPLLNITNED